MGVKPERPQGDSRWIPPNYVQANPDEDVRDDGRVGSAVLVGLILLGVVVLVGLLIFVMVSPP